MAEMGGKEGIIERSRNYARTPKRKRMYLDQFTSEERAIIIVAMQEFTRNCRETLWQVAHALEKEEREKTERHISLAKDVLEKIELNNIWQLYRKWA